MNPLLQADNLSISFETNKGEIQAVRGVSFNLNESEVLAIVGESGSGKSVTSQSLLQLVPTPPGKYKSGKVMFKGKNLLALPEREIQQIRGRHISMIFQDPMTSLNPTMTIGRQLVEGIVKHRKLSKSKAQQHAVEMLRLVGIPNAAERLKQHPHQFSGGMRQRVMIAMALACEPQILIADEPTTALDVTIQAQILDLMKQLQDKIGTSIILITHDLGVVANLAQRIVVMYAGQIVEMGTTNDLFYAARHPYTWGLLMSMPRLNANRNESLTAIPGTPPDLADPPQGCPFAARCHHVMRVCEEEMPAYTEITPGHKVACWLEHPLAPKVQPPAKITKGAAK